MLHILLTILKIIGIILLVIIGLVLLICSCILFVPIRYSARIKYKDTADVCVRVTYLLRLISIKYLLIGNDKKTSIKILGIDINKFKRKKNNNSKNNNSGKNDSKNAKSVSKKSKTKFSKEHTDLDKEESSDIIEGIEGVEETLIKDNNSTDKSSPKKEKISLYQKIKKKILSLKNKIIYRFKSFCGKIKKAILKVKDFKEFIQDEHTKKAFKLLKDELIKLLKYIKPRKIKGYINFGFDDPSLTGKILGAYYAIMKASPKKFRINPDFENTKLETDVLLKGRISLYYIIYIAVRIYLNKDFKYVMKNR